MFHFKIGKLFFGVSQNHIFKDVKQISSKTVAMHTHAEGFTDQKGSKDAREGRSA